VGEGGDVGAGVAVDVAVGTSVAMRVRVGVRVGERGGVGEWRCRGVGVKAGEVVHAARLSDRRTVSRPVN
jgi:hypothetical protein